MPGKPVVVALEENVDFEAEFTLGSHSLPSHEFDRLMAAQRRVTDATTLRNTTHSTVPTVENTQERREPSVVNEQRSVVTEPPVEVRADDVLMEEVPAPPQEEGNQEDDQEMMGELLMAVKWLGHLVITVSIQRRCVSGSQPA